VEFMTISDIERDIMNAPTMMTVDEELNFFQRLMELSAQDINTNWGAFRKILDRLYESHTQSFFSVNASNKELFFKAAGWLESIVTSDSKRAAELRSMAEHFRIDPDISMRNKGE
jgi:hypothetical protein